VGAMAEDGKFRVEKFNSQNYQLWKMQMEDYLYQNDLFLPLVGIAKKFDNHEGQRMGGSRQKGTENDTVEPRSVRGFNISKEKTTKELMDALAKLYEKPSVSNKVFIMKMII
jgi:hypothetical protein